jgi:hypothetical protein
MSEESGFQMSDHAPLRYQAQVEYVMALFVEAMVATTVKRGDARPQDLVEPLSSISSEPSRSHPLLSTYQSA